MRETLKEEGSRRKLLRNLSQKRGKRKKNA